MPQHQKDRLIITACGPIMTLPRNLGFSVQNLISKGDSYSLHFHKELKDDPHAYDSFADVQLLEQQDSASWFTQDHFFKSKTYQEGIKLFSVSQYDEYGVLK